MRVNSICRNDRQLSSDSFILCIAISKGLNQDFGRQSRNTHHRKKQPSVPTAGPWTACTRKGLMQGPQGSHPATVPSIAPVTTAAGGFRLPSLAASSCLLTRGGEVWQCKKLRVSLGHAQWGLGLTQWVSHPHSAIAQQLWGCP